MIDILCQIWFEQIKSGSDTSSQKEISGRNSSFSMWCCLVGHKEVLELIIIKSLSCFPAYIACLKVHTKSTAPLDEGWYEQWLVVTS